MSELFFEIGTEEIPSSYIRPAMEALGNQLSAHFSALGIPSDDVKTFATPRRLAVSIMGLPHERPAKTVKHFGPPARAAFAPDGSPTKAATGFAKTKGVDVSALKVEATEKGEYVYAEIEEGGEKMVDLLAGALEKITLGLPFPKSMIWGDSDIRFTRPIRWIAALFDGEVIPMGIGSIKAANKTKGHRFLADNEVAISGRADYVAKLKENFVIADVDERKSMIIDESRKMAESRGASLLEDEDLAETVAFLTEWPVPLWGAFDEQFIVLPDELLTASMKNHQKMFSVKGASGKLTNGFIGVSNMKVPDDEVVVSGYRRVLRARLSDAKFFFDEDRKKTLDHFAEKLNHVTYQKKLGTVGEKIGRIVAVAEWLADKIAPEKKAVVSKAARLCKADLSTQMVYEFPELQGVMGREYAQHAGEPEEVCAAIFDHYLPRGAGDILPSGVVGAIVSIADKIDTITGCFGVGLIPTGAQDPFALRRQTLGIIQIVFDAGYTISLDAMLDAALGNFGARLEHPADEVKKNVLEFFGGRLKNLWTGTGVSHDVADAVLAAGYDDLADAHMRVTAMSELKKRDFFEALAITFKRVANITVGHTGGAVDDKLFEKDVESALLAGIKQTSDEVAPMLASRQYLSALEKIAGLRPTVDKFFDEVMVMVDDVKIRENRLNLLKGLSSMFLKIADFSRLVA